MTYERDVVSLAARVGTTSVLLSEKVPNFVSTVQSFFQNMVKSSPDFHVIDHRFFSRKLTDNHIQYTDMAKVTLFVPSGLSVDYATWLTLMEECAEATLTLESRVLDPFLSWVGLLTSDDSRLLSRRVNEGLGEVEFADLEALKKKLEGCFSRRVKDERAYKDLVSRNKDWDDVVDRTNLLNERTARIRPKAIHEKCNTLSQYLTALAEHLSDPDTVERFNTDYAKTFNRDIVSTLATMTYDVAREVEFFSVYVYYLEATTQAVEDSLAKLKKIAKL